MTPSPVKMEIKAAAAKPDNKLIVSNMKSVINSVKLHKKHKKRKRAVDETPEIHDISNILQSNLSFISPNRAEPMLNDKENPKGQWEFSEGNVTKVKILKISEPNVTTIPEVQPTIDDVTISSEDSTKENNGASSPSVEIKKSQSASNAFEFMMTARYKSIGTNSPGKELANKEVKTSISDSAVKVKRKLMLEEWADRKGRAKKRIIEAADDEYIDMVMEKRAKRLRTLLQNGDKCKEVIISDEEPAPTKPARGVRVKVAKGKNRIVDSEDEERSDKVSSKPSNRRNRKETNSVADDVFLEHLSSPLKKRDSLLGYFSKLTKTPSAEGSPSVTTPDTSNNSAEASGNKIKNKKRGRPRKTLLVEDGVVAQSVNGAAVQPETLHPEKEAADVVTVDDETVTCLTPSAIESTNSLSEGRPKRQCRDKKISYLIDEDCPPLKTRQKRPTDKDYTVPNSSPKHSRTTTPKPTKLAPIFAKATPKPLIDPTVLRARHEFLMSGIPEKMKLEIEKQRQFEEFYETEYEVFPKVSHVGHYTEPSNVLVDWSALKIRFRPVEDEESHEISFKANGILKVQKTFSEIRKSSKAKGETVEQKELMRQLKQDDATEFPYYRCFKQLKQKTAMSPADDDEDEAKAADCDNSIELIVEKVASTNGDELFTEKYRPMTPSEVLINTRPLTELEKFLATWKENRECTDSSDDYASNSNSGISSTNKAIVLSGPPGCGKTMFVYALANEMNFKVLEINAGAKRSGKRVLKKLQEATQSHHVNNNQCSQGDRTKNGKWEDSEESGGTQKQSLILIEDAEIVFEEDIGFVESINQLITTTKRPVILITNQINCPHLSRFMSRNMILFKVPKMAFASKWLSTLSVAEQCYVTEDMCRTLYQRNNGDFRKTLLELQFFIQSSKRTFDSSVKSVVYTNTKLHDLFFADQNQCERIVPFPVDFMRLNDYRALSDQHDATKNGKNRKSKKVKPQTPDAIDDALDFLSVISTAQWFEQKTESSDRILNHLSDEISHFMVEQSLQTRSRKTSNCQDAATVASDSVTR